MVYMFFIINLINKKHKNNINYKYNIFFNVFITIYSYIIKILKKYKKCFTNTMNWLILFWHGFS